MNCSQQDGIASNLRNPYVQNYSLSVQRQFGQEWLMEVAWVGSKGTKLVSLSGNVVSSGVVEVPMGTPLRKIVYDIGGGVAAVGADAGRLMREGLGLAAGRLAQDLPTYIAATGILLSTIAVWLWAERAS